MPRFLLLSALFLLSGTASADTGGVNIAVSIKPLHSLVSNITQGVNKPDLIVAASGSPHGYNLRPSEVRMLQRADLVIWVGPMFESFMVNALNNLGQESNILTLQSDVSGLQLFQSRESGQWGKSHNETAHAHHKDITDPHIWLSPYNARIITTAITRELRSLDPDNSSRYEKNHDLLLQRLTELETALAERLNHLQHGKYIVFHDAYQYFEKSFKLEPVGALAIDPDRQPGARRLLELKQAIRDLSVECVFTEPQFEPRLVKVLTEGANTRTGILDPLGAELQQGSELYFNLMEQMAASLEECLPESKKYYDK